LNAQDFIRSFVANEFASYVDLGQYDCGISETDLYIRDKSENTVTQLSRDGLSVSWENRINRSYYLATVGLLVMAFYFSVFFMRDALGNDVCLLAVLGLYVAPFIMRKFASGYKIIGYYFALCILFSFLVGSWKENQLGSGVLIFFVVGVLPYVGSRVFLRIWAETRVTLRSGDKSLSLVCQADAAERLSKALAVAD